jgi:hypothetical protein
MSSASMGKFNQSQQTKNNKISNKQSTKSSNKLTTTGVLVTDYNYVNK